MQIVGVVAEYNPFHNGHRYHLQQTIRALQPDGVVAIISGNFTQRGEPALYDKWTRAAMALHCGVDLVLELPAAFALRSASYFAQGAVLSLAATGIVTHLSCGAETRQPDQLLQIARYLSQEPDDYRQALRQQLQTGLSYPAARASALTQMGLEAQAIQLPNNILALEYLQTILRHKLPLQPWLLTRQGSYHDATLPQQEGTFASASAIRRLLLAGDDGWRQQLPPEACAVLTACLQAGIPPMQLEHFAQMLFALLRRSTPQQLQEIIEVTEGLEHRIHAAAFETNSLAALCSAIKSKRYTYTRIQRFLLHLLLHMTQTEAQEAPQYLRVLGFNDTGRRLLRAMKKEAKLPVLTRPGREQKLLSPQGRQLFALDCRATDLYYMGYRNPALWHSHQDYLRMPVQPS